MAAHSLAMEGPTTSSGSARRLVCPAVYGQEEQWLFKEPFHSPCIPINDQLHMQQFSRLIWDFDPKMMLHGFDATPEELAHLCGVGSEGWLLSCHINWVVNKLNQTAAPSHTTMVFSLDTLSPDLIADLSQQKADGKLDIITRLTVILNVGKGIDEVVYIADPKRSGYHWTVAVIDLQGARITYCDSMAWNLPSELFTRIEPLLEVFGGGQLWDCFLAHCPTPTTGKHSCTQMCLNYPLQECTDMCGVVSLVFAAVSMLNEPAFKMLTGPRLSPPIFLQQPTMFSRFLRRQLIRWFVTGVVDVDFVVPPNGSTVNLLIMPSTFSVTQSQKRQSGDDSNTDASSQDTLSSPLPPPAKRQKEASQPEEASTQIQFQCKFQLAQDSIQNLKNSSSQHSVTEKKTAKSKVKIIMKSPGDGSMGNKNMHKGSAADSQDTGKDSHQQQQNSGTQSSVSKIQPSQHKPSTKGSQNTEKTQKSKPRKCPVCDLVVSARQSLVRHIRRKHPGVDPRTGREGPNPHHCSLCDSFSCIAIQDLAVHCRSVHGKSTFVKESNFPNAEHFERWKKEMEQKSLSRFVSRRGARKNASHAVQYFMCHRSGKSKIKAAHERQRKLKTQGSCKICSACTAFMTVFTSLEDGSVRVLYCLDHVGHDLDLAHLPISSELKDYIAAQCTNGVEPQQLLDDIRTNITGVNRDMLVTRKDIRNIQKYYKLAGAQKQVAEETSTSWEKELSQGSESPIIYYKAEGQRGDQDCLQESDFLLCIQTPFQKEMLRKHGSQFVYAESPHKTADSDFVLTTLLVVDELHEATPAAWAISNRDDEEIVKLFISIVKKANGGADIETDIFMTDLSPCLFNAWCTVFTQPRKLLYRLVYVEKAWKNKTAQLIKPKEEQTKVNGFLKHVQMETNVEQFRNKLQELLTYLQYKHKSFYDYFYNDYVSCNRELLWASCHRSGTMASTNMYAEACHKVLREVHLHVKQNKEVDNLLFALLKYARDKALDQLHKALKGKATYHCEEVRKRHRAARKSIQTTDIRDGTSDNEWFVPPGKPGADYYRVKKIISECQCKLTCSDCGVCDHMFTCQCSDFLTRAITCKHIHAVQMRIKANSPENPPSVEKPVQSGRETSDDHIIEFFTPFIVKDNSDIRSCENVLQLRTTALAKANELVEVIKKTDSAEVLKAIIQRVESIIPAVKSVEEQATKKQIMAAPRKKLIVEIKDNFPPSTNLKR